MKQPWPKRVLLLCGLVAAAVVYTLLLRPHEPEDENKPLSYWCEMLKEPGHQDALNAIQRMGPEVVPFLLGNAKRGESFARSSYFKVWSRVPIPVRQRLPKPDLTSLAEVSYLLAQLGPPALPRLCEAMKDRNEVVQHLVHLAVTDLAPKANSDIVAKMLPLLEHPDGQVRGETAFAFTQMGTNAHPPEDVIAALSRRVADPHPYAREEAAFARWRIGHDTNAVGLLVAELEKTSDLQIATSILDHLRDMGAAAAPVLPAVSNAVFGSPRMRCLSNHVGR